MMLRSCLLIFTALALLLPCRALSQSFPGDSVAVFYFEANVERSLNPEADKGRTDFFRLRDLDRIYEAFMSELRDSAGVNAYPIEHLMKLKGTPKMEYPRYALKMAVKRGAAPLYVKATILFFDAGGRSSSSSMKMSGGLLSSKKDVQKKNLRMTVELSAYTADGTLVKKVSAEVLSDKPVALVSSEGLNMEGLAKLAKGKPAEEPGEDGLTQLVREGARELAKQLK